MLLDHARDPLVTLAGGAHNRAIGHSPTLVSTRVAASPAVVVRAAAARTACHPRSEACAHPPDEPGKCPVGRTAYPGRAGKARDTGLTHHRCEVYGSTAWSAVADMAYLLAPSCQRCCGQWSLWGARPPSSCPVRSGDSGAPLVAGLLDDDQSAAVCTAGHRVPHTAERSHVCAEHPGSRSYEPYACPRTESTQPPAARPPGPLTCRRAQSHRDSPCAFGCIGHGAFEGRSPGGNRFLRHDRAGEGCLMASCLMMRPAEEFLVGTGNWVGLSPLRSAESGMQGGNAASGRFMQQSPWN